MPEGVVGVSQDDITPVVKSLRLKLPDGVSIEDAVDALQVASVALRKSQNRGEGPPLSPNAASKELLRHVEESYDLMAESLVKEINDVFAEIKTK